MLYAVCCLYIAPMLAALCMQNNLNFMQLQGAPVEHSFTIAASVLIVFELYYIDYNYVSYSVVSITSFIYPIVPIKHSKNSGSKQKILKIVSIEKKHPVKKSVLSIV